MSKSLMAGLLVHWPRVAVSFWPTRTVPEIDGAAVLTGRCSTSTSLGADCAYEPNSALKAHTTILTVWPMSSRVRVYVRCELSGDLTPWQSLPLASQRLQ